MKEMCLGGKLSKTYTNHCYLLSHSGLTRAFQLITLWVFQAMSMSRGLWYFICRQVFASLCTSAWYSSVMVTEMHIVETHPLKNVVSENVNKWKWHILCQSRNPQCISLSWLLFLLRHPHHLPILQRRIELHATINNSSVYLKTVKI